MKIVLIILCAFLLKAEADAQTWWNISPKNMDNRLRQLKVYDSEDNSQYVIAHSDTSMYFLTNSKVWSERKSFNVMCIQQQTPYIYDIYSQIQNIFRGAGDTLYVFYMLYAGCDSPDGVGFIAQSTTFENLLNYKADTVFWQGSYWDTYNGTYSPYSNQNYLLMGDWGNLRFATFDHDTVQWKDSIIPDNEQSEYDVSGLWAQPKKGHIYASIRNRQLDRIFRYSENDTIWTLVASMEAKEDNFGRQLNKFYKVAFGNNPNNVFISTSNGLWRYNDSTNQTDTLLKVPTRSIFFKDSSDIAYAGTDSGEIYRSTDAGETWSLFASGFSTKPVIGIYASGGDSLIVGTEDGIWANYALPVSVDEEIPFKNNELFITPNPANTSLKISFLKTELPQQLSIYNSLGQLVFKTEFLGEFVWDFTNDIPDGVYTVTVQAGEKSVARQVMILR